MPRFVSGVIKMSETTGLLGISNAIVDVLAHVDDDVITKVGAPPGSMTLVDLERAREVYAMMGPATEMSGGSVANSVAGFANLGGSAAYIGNVKNDQLGDIFRHDMRSLGIDVRLPPAIDGSPTARCQILITEDGQRTMQTYLGACTELSLDDISEETVGSPAIVLLEGYVWDIAEGPQLAKRAAEIVKRNGGRVALSLSDSFCVERHRDAFHDAVTSIVDIVVADEDELNALLQTSSFEASSKLLADYDNLFAITRSEKGSVIRHGTDSVVQAATTVNKIVDTTGAGDAYTAGFLYGLAENESLAECARLGTFCATQVIQQVGARIPPGIKERYK